MNFGVSFQTRWSIILTTRPSLPDGSAAGHRIRKQHGCLDMDGEMPVPDGVIRKITDAVFLKNRGIVDQQLHRPELILCVANKAAHCIAVGEIGLHHASGATRRIDIRQKLFALVAGMIAVDRYSKAMCSQILDNRLANPLCATGYKNNGLISLQVVGSFMRRFSHEYRDHSMKARE